MCVFFLFQKVDGVLQTRKVTEVITYTNEYVLRSAVIPFIQFVVGHFPLWKVMLVFSFTIFYPSLRM